MDSFRSRAFALSAGLLILTALPAHAGTDSWSVVGQPPGGRINHSVVDPVAHNVVYAAASDGLFKSTDSGADWSLLLAPFSITGSAVYDVALEPEAHKVLYAAAGSDGVYVSMDAGASWTQSNKGITGLAPLQPADSVQYVSADPVNDGTAYASTVSNGVFKTTDHGQHWTAMNSGFPTPFVNGSSAFLFGRVVIDPTNTLTLYLALGEQGPFISQDGVYTSTDGGSSWSLIYGSLDITQVVLDLQNTTNLYAIENNSILHFITNTGGAQTGTFTQPPQPTAIAADPSNDQNLVAGTQASGLYVSSNGGGSWSPAGSSTTLDVQDLAMDPTTPATLYVGSAAFGIYASGDSGASLTGGIGLFGPTADSLLMGSDRVLYMGTLRAGVLKSNDRGASWSFANTGITGDGTSIIVLSLAQDPNTPATLYTGTVNGAFKTTDGGGSWASMGALSGASIGAITVDPENSLTLYAGVGAGGLYKSLDGGTTWNPTSPGLPGGEIVTALAVDPTSSTVVYAGTDQNGLYGSSDGGMHWSLLNTGISGVTTKTVLAIGIDPFNHRNLFATAVGVGVLHSSDGGASWKNVGGSALGTSSFYGVTFDPKHSGTVYLSSWDQPAVAVTHDGGASWTSIGNLGSGNMISTESVGMLALDPQDPTVLYGAGSDGQIYTYGVDAPTALAGTLSTREGNPADGQLAYSLPGYTGNVTYAVATPPAHGTMSLTDASTGSYTYTPSAGFSGKDSFTFTVTAGVATSGAATVDITVTSTSSSGSTGGGGMFPLWLSFLLLGFAARKRKRER